MSIRTKFFALAGILLALFGVVVGALSLLQRQTADNLTDIVGHHLPITRLLADIDVETFEYELQIERLRRRDDLSPGELAKIGREIDARGEHIRRHFEEVRRRLDEAVAFNRHDSEDVRALARAQGALKFLYRNVDPFLAAGNEVKTAVLEGRRDDATRLIRNMDRFEETFGPDLEELRHELVRLTDEAADDIRSDQSVNAWLSFGLFLVASAVGLVVSGVGSSRVIAALRNLLRSTREVEAGCMDVLVPVVTHDEVGELARAFNRMIGEIRQRERIKETFGKFVDPRIVTRLISGSDGTLDHADRRMVTIFFSDIVGFSGLSERLTATAMVNLLNAYYSDAAEVIHARHGIIDKYIGDSVMAFWTTPFSTSDDHAAEACLAALEQHAALAEFRKRLPEITGLRRDTPEIAVRMGIATGEAVVGTVGSPAARSFTVIGDTVNLASRLEGVNKTYGTGILIAEDTYRLAQTAIEAREIDLVTVAGKSEPIRIYEVLAPAGGLDATSTELREKFAAALAAYRRRAWDEAAQLFAAARALVPADRPSAVFLERIEELRTASLPDGWDGVWRLTSK